MPQFLVERELPGAGRLSPVELNKLSLNTCRILDTLGPRIRWLHSYVTRDKMYCLYEAQSEALIRRHAALEGFSVSRIEMIFTVIDPVAAWSAGQGAA